MNQLEQDLLALAAPLIQQLWTNDILPKLQAEVAKVSQTELAVLSQDGLAFVSKVVGDELAALQTSA